MEAVAGPSPTAPPSTARSAFAPTPGVSPTPWLRRAVPALLILLAVAPFWHVWLSMARVAMRDASLGYILLIPIAAFGLAWQRRKLGEQVVVRHRWVGLLVVALGLAAQLGYIGTTWNGLGWLGWFLGPVLVLYGTIVAIWGVGVVLPFAAAFAVFLMIIPPPTTVLSVVTHRLMFLSATMTTDLLRLMGFEVQQQLNLMVVNGEEVNVAEACSGLRSFFSLFVVISVFALAMPFRWWVRIVMLALTPVMSLLGNMVRLIPTCMMYSTGHQGLADTAHDLLGFVAFAAIVLMYLGGLKALAWAGIPTMRRRVAVVPTNASLADDSQNGSLPGLGHRLGLGRWPIPIVAVLAIMAAATPAISHHWPTRELETYHQRVAAAVQSAQFDLPGMAVRDSGLPGVALNLLQPNAFRCVELRDPDGTGAMYVSLIQSRHVRDMAGHTPAICYTNAGWLTIDKRQVNLTMGDQSVPFTEYRFQRARRDGLSEIFVLNAFITPDGRFSASEQEAIGDRNLLGPADPWGIAQLSIAAVGLSTPAERDARATRLLEANADVFRAISLEVTRN